MRIENPQRGDAPSNPTAFVAEVFDQETDSIIRTYSFEVHDIADLCRALGIETFEPWTAYDLDESDIETLHRAYGITIDWIGPVRLRMRGYFDEHPYVLHTNRELLLMLEGRKPLSVFVDDQLPPTGQASTLFPEAKFDSYVAAGRFVKHEYFEPADIDDQRRIRRVFYALPEETWRIKAYMLLIETSNDSGWNEGFERMEGSLLGYSREENDIHIVLQRKHAKNSGCAPGTLAGAQSL
jgi:hypothetical protein